ncbi:MAG: class I SAM-dependent methyltransferase, partial [Anaerolineae bacterium]|nr:class I SAM-dependent methyltransferase [Anaerolineae bacterium]
MSQPRIQDSVQDFYDRVGWQKGADDLYQNARYEDLRPVSREYIHRCHLRVGRHLPPGGDMLLDAGSGPVQYEEYLTYSAGYRKRVCLDISIVALQEARQRLGDQGEYVVADVARLPFASAVFDGAVSLHTLHHLSEDEQLHAYREIHRVLMPDRRAVVVNGWTYSPLMRFFQPLVAVMEWVGIAIARLRGKPTPTKPTGKAAGQQERPTGTFVRKLDARRLRDQLDPIMPYEIRAWRSVSVRFLRAVIHAPLAGKYWLRLLFWLEERFPRWFG